MKEHFYHSLSPFIFLFSITCIILFSNTGHAQAPPFVPYQAIAREANGSAVANQTIGLRFSIHDQTLTGSVVWQEVQTITSNALGVVNTNIGQVLDLSGVNWGNGSKFLQVEMDITGGTNYVDMGTQQMMSVPYALFAGQAASVGSSSNIQIGQTYQGGTVFYIDHTGEHGLIISDTTISGIYVLPNNVTDLRFIDLTTNAFNGPTYLNTSHSVYSGSINTKYISEKYNQNPDLFDHVLSLTYNGYDNWFIPSRDELFLAFSALGSTYFQLPNGEIFYTSTFTTYDSSNYGAAPYVMTLDPDSSNPYTYLDRIHPFPNWPEDNYSVKLVREF